MIDTSSGEVRHEVVVAMTPKHVWPLVSEGARMMEWIYDTRSLILEPRIGGRFEVDFGDAAFEGYVISCEPLRRMAFTWGSTTIANEPLGSSVVEITLAREGTSTRVTLVQRGGPSSALAGNDEGWGVYLARLAKVLGGAA